LTVLAKLTVVGPDEDSYYSPVALCLEVLTVASLVLTVFRCDFY